MEQVYVKADETTEHYRNRIFAIEKDLDPKTTRPSLCDLIYSGDNKFKCDDEIVDSTIRSFAGYQKSRESKEKFCESLSSAIREIQTLRQRGKPIQLFKEDMSEKNDVGSYSDYLISYVFRNGIDKDSRLLASDLELKCLKRFDKLLKF
ncbi:hypothetical protein [Advenella sp. FME57]|uniref:hypothetical protein n=1 Tax=Advenella sp. FME57 TaxID=2742604 RepID=UPI0018686F43|nr:hypothetical protein [Advenella sp. FME57]